MSRDKECRVALLLFIKERKEILFGKLTPTVTNEVKHAEWKKVHEKAQSLGMVAETKPWKYIRDSTWSNWKKRALEKRDKRSKTGEAGGKECRLTDEDNLILDILGKDSPVINGLEVRESMADPVRIEIVTVEADVDHTASDIVQTSVSEKSVNPAKRKQKEDSCVILERELKVEKLQLQVDLLKVEKRRKAIEVFRLEAKYDFGPSEFTKEFHDLLGANTEMDDE